MNVILNLDGTLQEGAIDPQLTQTELIHIYDTMVQVRILDEKGLRLQRQGRIGFHIPTTGEESHVAAVAALNSNDWIFPSYRQHGGFIYRGVQLEEYVNHLFGNQHDPQHGRRLPGLLGNASVNFVNPSAPIGTQIIQAAGVAYAQKLAKDSGVTIVFFGDGATSSNDFHSGLNFGAVTKSPVIFICMNNQYAISVPLHKQTAAKSLIDKAIGYGLPGIKVDGNDVLAMYTVTKNAVERARRGEGPTFIEAFTYRVGPHTSSDDPTKYRDSKEVQEWIEKDPITRFKKYLLQNHILTEEDDNALWAKYNDILNQLITDAVAVEKPALETLFTDVYETMPQSLQEQLADAKLHAEAK